MPATKSITKKTTKSGTKRGRDMRSENKLLSTVPCWVKIVTKKLKVNKPDALTHCILEYVDLHLPNQLIGNEKFYGLCFAHLRDHLLLKMRELVKLQDDDQLLVRTIESRLKRCLNFWGKIPSENINSSVIHAFKSKCSSNCICTRPHCNMISPPCKLVKLDEEDTLEKLLLTWQERNIIFEKIEEISSPGSFAEETAPHSFAMDVGDVIFSTNPFSPTSTFWYTNDDTPNFEFTPDLPLLETNDFDATMAELELLLAEPNLSPEAQELYDFITK